MIRSTTNAKVKYVRKLQADKRFRRRERAYVIEGTRWFQEVEQHARQPEMIFYTQSWADAPAHTHILQQVDAPSHMVSDEVMAAMSDTHSPAGVLAVLPIRPKPLPTAVSLLLILDSVMTPGNLGTMLRTAAAASVDGVLLSPGCVDPYNPKVVRGSMGAHLRLPVLEMEWPQIAAAVHSLTVYVADVGAHPAYTAVSWRQPTALIIGGEAYGAGPQAWALAHSGVTIPMHDETESLNAAIAAGVILFEAKRQRDLLSGVV